MREFEGFRLKTVADEPALAYEIQEMIERLWPKFVTQAGIPKGHKLPFDWMGIYRRWPHLQFVLTDPADETVVAAGNSLVLDWDGLAEELPDEGWNWAMYKGESDYEAGRKPNTGSALAITLDPTRRGQNLSQVAVRAMRLLLQETGITRFFAPVRPTTKALYPITPIAEFCRWTTAEGLPLDPWLRVHARLGAKMIKPCVLSQPVAGSVAEWEEWIKLKLPASGDYVAPGLLAPLHIDLAADEGVCWEPNVWMEHPI